MPVLVRKISRAKWERNAQFTNDDEISADAITADLRTTNNTLSFWRSSSSEAGDLKRAVLALAASAERLDKLDVVYLDEEAVRDAGLATANTPGQTPVISLRDHHVDVERLDLNRLCIVARMVAGAHRTNTAIRLTKHDVLALVVAAVKAKLVDLDELKGEVKSKVGGMIGDER